MYCREGERPMAAQNKSIGQFNLTGIAPARRGVPQIESDFRHRCQWYFEKCLPRDKATGKERGYPYRSFFWFEQRRNRPYES